MDSLKKKVARLIRRKPEELGVADQPSSTSTAVQNASSADVESSEVVNSPRGLVSENSRYNFKIVHDPPEPIADVIFLHGLTGDRENTWTRKKGRLECFWPRDLLSEDINNVRIAVWGYDASVIRKTPLAVVSTNTLDEHAQTLCNDIASLRKDNNTQAIIFVVHSLGGLVCKAALLHSSEAQTTERMHLKNVAERTKAIAFLGTPHQGSSLASWGTILASLLGYVKQNNKQIIQTLEAEAPHLNELQKRFSNLLEYRKQRGDAIDITCFYEELPLPGLGKVVPNQSATLASYESIGIHDDHSGMTKYGGDDSQGYKRVLGELHRWVTNLTPNRLDGETEEESTQSSRGAIVNHHGNVTGGGVAIYGNQKFENSGTTNFGGTHTTYHDKQG